jgi:hypothetical protein
MATGIDLFSDWTADISPETRNSWLGEIDIRQEYKSYFTGEIFNENIPSDSPTGEEAKLYPVGMNLVKTLCIIQADSMFGNWDESIVRVEPAQDSKVEDAEKEASALAYKILSSSNASTLLWEIALDREIYGGAPIKIMPDLRVPGFIRWTRVALDSFFPIWDPDDLEILLEAYIAVEMTREQALAKYNYKTEKETVLRVEHWTRSEYTNTIDGLRIDEYSGRNPWGFVPFVYIPRLRSTNYWGDALTEEVKLVQDELNMRVADLGEAVNYNSHPIKWGYNLPKAFNSENYPVGPNTLWDMGKIIGSSNPPFVGVLEAKNPLPEGSQNYIQFLFDWSLTSQNTPPIALGIEGTSQRTGISLEVKMYPLLRAITRSRSYMSAGILQALRYSALILNQKDISVDLGGPNKRALKKLINKELVVRYASIMPRDQASITDQIVKQLSTTPPVVSLESAAKDLGRGTAEVERIREMLSEDILYSRGQKQFVEEKPAGKDSGTGAENGNSTNEAS